MSLHVEWESPLQASARAMASVGLPDFSLELFRRVYEWTTIISVCCGGACVEVEITAVEVQSAERDGLDEIVRARVVAAAERLWARWMAL